MSSNPGSPDKSKQIPLFNGSDGDNSLRKTPPPLTSRYGPAKRVPDEFFFPKGIITLERIVATMQEWGHKDVDSFVKAHRFQTDIIDAEEKRAGHPLLREDGTPYEQHLARVAFRVAVVGGGLDATTPAYLHDSIEDFSVPLGRLVAFGAIVPSRVSLLTKGKWNPAVSMDWVYPENENYYFMEDLYERSMYDLRARSTYDRLTDSADMPCIMIKGIDNIDNLIYRDPMKQQRNMRTMVHNTLAILMRMLAWEDVNRLTEFIREKTGFEVPEALLAPPANLWVETNEPRDIMLRKGIRGMLTGLRAPRFGQINVYGASARYVLPLGWCEIGLPNDGREYAELLQKVFPEYLIEKVESKLPPGLPASEQMFRIYGMRDEGDVSQYKFSLDEKSMRLGMEMGGTRLSLRLHALDMFTMDDRRLNATSHDIDAKCYDLVAKLRAFHKDNILPLIEKEKEAGKEAQK